MTESTMNASRGRTGRASKASIVAALLAVYFIWGSTYLALRFGLEGFPPLLLNGFRFLIAGSLLLAFLLIRGGITVSRRQLWNAARMGVVLLLGGVGLVTIAESLGVGSGVAATAVAMIPVWAALISGLFGSWPGRREWIGLGIGLIGVVVLAQEGDFQASPIGMVLIVVSPIIWAFGSVWGSRLELPGSMATTVIELLTAGLLLTFLGTLLGERVSEPPPAAAWAALVYLATMGSIVAFTAYIYLIKTVRPALATSYAYVNPVVAVVLGLTLGGEMMTGPVFIALPLILAGVALVATANRGGGERSTRPLPSPADLQEEAA
jgi:drug/metabolite transporter (DMT)-like permease